MRRRPSPLGVLLVTGLFWPALSFAFLGVGDTSFVTVIANPAEAANWATQLNQLTQAVQSARATLQTVEVLKTYAGDPRLALESIGGLGDVSGPMANLSSDAQTLTALNQAWSQLSAAQQSQAILDLLARGGSDSQMLVFGQPVSRTLGSYAPMATDVAAAENLRNEISIEQSIRTSLIAELAKAWSDFGQADSESRKQALLTKITQLNAQGGALEGRRRALMDDLVAADRARAGTAAISATAADEQLLAESKALNTAVSGRVSQSDSQRLSILAKTPAQPPAHDYSAMKLWTPADAP